MNLPNKIQNILKDKKGLRNRIGMSGAGVYLYGDMVLKVQKMGLEAENEVAMMRWLKDKIPVPEIIKHIYENEYSYILMNKCTGKMACDTRFMMRPRLQVELLAEALHSL